jgi:hypothetical protein
MKTAGIFKVTYELVKNIHGNGFPVITDGVCLFMEMDIVNEGFDVANFTHIKLMQF